MLLYTLVTGVALSLGFVRGNPDLYHHPEPLLHLPFWVGLPAGALSGSAVGLAVVWLTQRAVTSWRLGPALRLHNGMRQILGVVEGPLGRADIFAIACSSAIAEELLFRGLFYGSLPSVLGLTLSSVIFGMLHYAPRTKGMWIWIPLAIVMGFAFGGLFLVVGNLTAPIVAHWVINYRNLHFINEYDPDLAEAPAPPAHPR